MTSCLGETMFQFIYIGELDPNDLENDPEVFLKSWRFKILENTFVFMDEEREVEYGGFPWAVSRRSKLKSIFYS